MAIFQALLSIFLVAISQLLFKKGLSRPSPADLGPVARVFEIVFRREIIGGLALNGLAAIFWLLALSVLELSYVFPFLSLNYALIPLAAAVLFGEKLSEKRLLGIGVVIAGFLLVAFS